MSYIEEREELKLLITKVFHKNKYPGRERVYTDVAGQYELEGLLKFDQKWDNDWCNIPSTLLLHHCSSLPFFSSEGFFFFMPAYLLAAIDAVGNINSEYDTLLMYVMYDLCHDPCGVLPDYHQQRYSKLNRQQQEAINAFLRFVIRYSNDDEYIPLAQQTIDSRCACPVNEK
jgi:hypothetical protein